MPKNNTAISNHKKCTIQINAMWWYFKNKNKSCAKDIA
jgi:hypothetical protein